MSKRGAQVLRETVIKDFDKKTGELKKEVKKVINIDSVFDEDRGYLFWNQMDYTKTFQNIDFPQDLSDDEIGKLTRLSKKIYSTTNMLGYRGNGGVKPYSAKQIGELIGLKERNALRFLKKMQKFKIIKPIPVDFGDRVEMQYYFNPIYYFSNRRLSLNLYLLFHEELDEVLPDWVIKEYAGAGVKVAVKPLSDK